MRFIEFKDIPKSHGEIPLLLPPKKHSKLSRQLNSNDKLEIENYNPNANNVEITKHMIVIYHTCPIKNETFKILIDYYKGGFLKKEKYWRYVIYGGAGDPADIGKLSSQEIARLNAILSNSASDFRFNIKDFLNYCNYSKISNFQQTLYGGV